MSLAFTKRDTNTHTQKIGFLSSTLLCINSALVLFLMSFVCLGVSKTTRLGQRAVSSLRGAFCRTRGGPRFIHTLKKGKISFCWIFPAPTFIVNGPMKAGSAWPGCRFVFCNLSPSQNVTLTVHMYSGSTASTVIVCYYFGLGSFNNHDHLIYHQYVVSFYCLKSKSRISIFFFTLVPRVGLLIIPSQKIVKRIINTLPYYRH